MLKKYLNAVDIFLMEKNLNHLGVDLVSFD
jgi:hypothetical protein